MKMLIEIPEYLGFDGMVAIEYESVDKATTDLFAILQRIEAEHKAIDEQQRIDTLPLNACYEARMALLDEPNDHPEVIKADAAIAAEQKRLQELLKTRPIKRYTFIFAGKPFTFDSFIGEHEGVPQRVTTPNIKAVDDFFK